jgi:hypothetical protein
MGGVPMGMVSALVAVGMTVGISARPEHAARTSTSQMIAANLEYVTVFLIVFGASLEN